MRDAAFDLNLDVDFGEDDGRDFGSLFEARDADGRVVCGAGFAAVYNTRYRNDRMALQFFIRQAEGDATFAATRLPPSTTSAGTYVFNCDGKLHAQPVTGDLLNKPLYEIGHDPRDADPCHRMMVWDEQAGQWHEDADIDASVSLMGDGKMRVAGKMLTFVNGTATYDGQVILQPPPDGEFYHHPFYALGHMVFLHKAGKTIRVVACAWKPGQTIDIGDAKAITTEHDRELPFAIGQFNGAVLVSTNLGWSYSFDGEQWTVVHAWRGPGSYQLYSAIHWYDKMLLAHYPSGYLLDYDGGAGVVLEEWPPGLEGLSRQSREAQTAMIYGGDLWVGVWPWAEIWRYDADAETWHFITRLQTHPEITDETIHPYDGELDVHNETAALKYPPNGLGQRNTGMATIGDSLMASASAKWTWPIEMKPEFLTEQQWSDYGRITKLTVPGCLTAPLKWMGKPAQVSLTVTSDTMVIAQDGEKLGELAITAEMAERVRGAEATVGNGVFGAYAGRGIAAR